MDASWGGIVGADPDGSRRVRLTGNVDGIETNGSNLDQYLVLAYLGGRRFLENDIFPLKIRW